MKHILGMAAMLAAAAFLPGRPALAADAFTFRAPQILANVPIGDKFVNNSNGCKGQNVSPDLKWSTAPAGTKSFGITIFDKDARKGAGWWHWLVFNIPANHKELKEDAGNPKGNKLEGATQSVTSFGTPGYGGPCPPVGEPQHRYVFTIYALNVDKLDAAADAKPEDVKAKLESHTIQKLEFVAHYGRLQENKY